MGAVDSRDSTSKHFGSYVDPAGTVYLRGDGIYRGIRPGFDRFYLDLLQNSSIREMLGREIVDTAIATSGIEGYPLTLSHRRLDPVNYCYEWPAEMLRQAAITTLDICVNLIDHGFVLQDAFPGNIIYESTNPVFVDFTSIVPQDPHLLWSAYEQFCHFFLWPLVLHGRGHTKVSRTLLTDQINGVPNDILVKLLPGRAVLRMPWLLARVHLPRLSLAILRTVSNDRALNNFTTRLNPNPEARRKFFRSLRSNVMSIHLDDRKSRWSRYYADVGSFLRPQEFDLKQLTVRNILEDKRPKTVTDIGCNQGGYSILAAGTGAKVTAFDTDEDSVSLLFQFARKERLKILPLVLDVLNPSPSCGWRAIEFASATSRLSSDMAIALAVVHHLAITQRQTFERIVPSLADYANKWLLTEFVPLTDPRSVELMATNRRDMSWYSLEGFLEALRKHFCEVQTLPSQPEGRTLVLCTR